MDNEFDRQASKILRENLEGVGWSDEYDIKEVTFLDKTPVWLMTSVLIAATICSMLLHIQLNY